MEFLKKHYEKVILSIVLLGLAVAAFMLMLRVQSVREGLDEASRTRQGRQKKQIPPVELTTAQSTVARYSKPISFRFAGTNHNLANPVPWGRDRSSNLYRIQPGRGIGPGGLAVKQTIPLNLIVAYEETAGTGDDLRYKFAITKDYAKQPNARRRTVLSATLGTKTTDGTMILREIKGPKESPTELICELIESGERVSISKEKPLIKPMGYSVDLWYEIEKKPFSARRVEDNLVLSQSSYKIVAISKDEVVISDPSTNKRFVIPSAGM